MCIFCAWRLIYKNPKNVFDSCDISLALIGSRLLIARYRFGYIRRIWTTHIRINEIKAKKRVLEIKIALIGLCDW